LEKGNGPVWKHWFLLKFELRDDQDLKMARRKGLKRGFTKTDGPLMSWVAYQRQGNIIRNTGCRRQKSDCRHELHKEGDVEDVAWKERQISAREGKVDQVQIRLRGEKTKGKRRGTQELFH